MRFRIHRVSDGFIDAPPPLDWPTLETIPDNDPEYGDGPEYFVTIETMAELVALDKAAGGHGLIVNFKPTDRGWYDDAHPDLAIYDGYAE